MQTYKLTSIKNHIYVSQLKATAPRGFRFWTCPSPNNLVPRRPEAQDLLSRHTSKRSQRCWLVAIAWVCSRWGQRLAVRYTSPITAFGQTPNNNTQDKNNIYQYSRYKRHFHFLRLLNCGFVVTAPTFIKPEILHSGHRLATSQIENLMRFWTISFFLHYFSLTSLKSHDLLLHLLRKLDPCD